MIDYSISQSLNDQAYDDSQAQMLKDFPIVKILPLVGPYETYRVDYGVSPTKPGQTAVYITYLGNDDKQAALDAIKKAGYNPDDYEIIYKPKAAVVPNAPDISGLSALLNRGMSGGDVLLVKNALATWFQNRQGNMSTVKQVSLDSNITHTISADSATHTYSAKWVLKGSTEKRLTMTVDANGLNRVTISDPNGVNAVDIFTAGVTQPKDAY